MEIRVQMRVMDGTRSVCSLVNHYQVHCTTSLWQERRFWQGSETRSEKGDVFHILRHVLVPKGGRELTI